MGRKTQQEEALCSGRYLLYLDILGFSTLVQARSVDKIYAVIGKALRAFDRWEELNHCFRTIYFSDTFLFYQDPKGYGNWAFLDIYAIGGMLLSSLLAKGIPARGSITFGEFECRDDPSSRRQLYFGKALVEAYRSEKREQWIGIAIQPSAWTPYEAANPGMVACFEGDHAWRIRQDGVLLLNPFIKLTGWYQYDLEGEITCPYTKWDRPDFPNDIRGFRFLIETAAEYARRGDFSGHEAVKYHSTVAFLRDVMGEDIYRWAKKISRQSTDAHK